MDITTLYYPSVEVREITDCHDILVRTEYHVKCCGTVKIFHNDEDIFDYLASVAMVLEDDDDLAYITWLYKKDE